MTTQSGLFTIPTRIFLAPEHRRKLDVLIREQDVDLPELLTELIASYLDQLPDLEPPNEIEHSVAQEVEATIHARRAELRRLRARATTGGDEVPQWLKAYMADIEAEIKRLEESR